MRNLPAPPAPAPQRKVSTRRIWPKGSGSSFTQRTILVL